MEGDSIKSPAISKLSPFKIFLIITILISIPAIYGGWQGYKHHLIRKDMPQRILDSGIDVSSHEYLKAHGTWFFRYKYKYFDHDYGEAVDVVGVRPLFNKHCEEGANDCNAVGCISVSFTDAPFRMIPNVISKWAGPDGAKDWDLITSLSSNQLFEYNASIDVLDVPVGLMFLSSCEDAGLYGAFCVEDYRMYVATNYSVMTNSIAVNCVGHQVQQTP